jgi:peptidoglycan/LPS O-acetylase OafA/YrhL
LPTFYLVLLAAYLLSYFKLWETPELSLAALLAQVFHVTNYYVIERGWWYGLPPGTWVYWSLAVEEHFYLIFPFLYWWLRKRKLSESGQALTLLGICAAVLLWRCALVFLLDSSRDRTYVATDTRIDSILAGCVLAVWRNPVLSKDGPSDRALGLVWLPIGIVAVAISVVIRVPAFEQTIRYTLQSFGLLPLFLAAIRWHDRSIFKLLNQRVLTYLGLLSYSMYLLHTSTLWALEHWTSLPELGRTVLALALLVALGTAMHRFVEKPATRLRRRFIG